MQGCRKEDESVAHQNDVIILLDLLHELLQALLELSPILGASHQEAHVQRDHLRQCS